MSAWNSEVGMTCFLHVDASFSLFLPTVLKPLGSTDVRISTCWLCLTLWQAFQTHTYRSSISSATFSSMISSRSLSHRSHNQSLWACSLFLHISYGPLLPFRLSFMLLITSVQTNSACSILLLYCLPKNPFSSSSVLFLFILPYCFSPQNHRAVQLMNCLSTTHMLKCQTPLWSHLELGPLRLD